jgi:hypothetical protein
MVCCPLCCQLTRAFNSENIKANEAAMILIPINDALIAVIHQQQQLLATVNGAKDEVEVGGDVITCERCEETTATGRCAQCEVNFCDDCFKVMHALGVSE